MIINLVLIIAHHQHYSLQCHYITIRILIPKPCGGSIIRFCILLLSSPSKLIQDILAMEPSTLNRKPKP